MSLKKRTNKMIRYLFKTTLYGTINDLIDENLSKDLNDYQNELDLKFKWYMYLSFTQFFLKQDKMVVTDKMIELCQKNELDEFICNTVRYESFVNFKDIELTKNEYKVFIEKLNDLMGVKIGREWRKFFNWKRWELKFRKSRNDNNLNGVIIQYLTNQCKPTSVWRDLVYLRVYRGDYITKTELEQFQTKLNYITTEFNQQIKDNINLQIKDMYRGDEWFCNNDKYWKCIEIFKEYLYTTT
tara:strand:- start:87 stop:809 length:723 start_codon:yes stop_codon:yes gene_type:complete